ncbi:hypothetical protein, partial [Enterobacter cloacae]|uniref:hypothetical protein n=1 Tax=Enterobacter cloacae TaxID=550 RepID=UPI0039C42333
SVRHIFKPISYLEIQLLSGVSGGYISLAQALHIKIKCAQNDNHNRVAKEGLHKQFQQAAKTQLRGKG